MVYRKIIPESDPSRIDAGQSARTQATGCADFAEQAVQRENQEVLAQIEEATLSELAQVEHALSRIVSGAANECERCDRPIGRRRLQALPWATTCSDCAQKSARFPRS